MNTMHTGIEVSIPSLEAAMRQAEQDAVAADRGSKEAEGALGDLESLLAVLTADAPERADLQKQRDGLRDRVERSQAAGARHRRIVEGLRRRLKAAREVALAQEAHALREQVATQKAVLRAECRKAAEALAVLLEAVQRVQDAGEGLTLVQPRLAAAERVLHPGSFTSGGTRFIPHPLLTSLLVGGDAALDWLHREARE